MIDITSLIHRLVFRIDDITMYYDKEGAPYYLLQSSCLYLFLLDK